MVVAERCLGAQGRDSAAEREVVSRAVRTAALTADQSEGSAVAAVAAPARRVDLSVASLGLAPPLSSRERRAGDQLAPGPRCRCPPPPHRHLLLLRT